jgi:HlyD family secretion protein
MKALFVRQDRQRSLQEPSHGDGKAREGLRARPRAKQLRRATAAAAMLLLLAACGDRPQDRFQGYVEGEFVYVASPLAGQLETLAVQRGQQVAVGQPLFALDETTEKAAREQIKAALVLSEAELGRQEKLFRSGVAANQELDRARSTRDQDKKRLDQTNWNFDQKKQNAPQSGLVYDTLFRQGEWVPAGKPVVVLLPPQNIKVRAFVPETIVGTIQYGDAAEVRVDGVQNPFLGKVSYISPRAEYTPPVIYSRETRAKLVFMVEMVFDPSAAANLHPGQPVDVQFKTK